MEFLVFDIDMASLSADPSTRLLEPDPILSTHNLFNPTSIFNVEDLVVVITGGGTGECQKQILGLALLVPR